MCGRSSSVPLRCGCEEVGEGGIAEAPFEVRGEVVMPLAAFERLNEEREREGLAAAVNPRMLRRERCELWTRLLWRSAGWIFMRIFC